MKPTEIRIGNLMQEHYTGKIITVIELTERSITFSDSFIGKWQADPIALTEEILLRCGFDIKPFSLGLTLDRFRFIWKTEYKYWYVVDAYSQSYLTKIEFVHELQNFIFVMNGQELNTSELL